jgi:hypothetical protein
MATKSWRFAKIQTITADGVLLWIVRILVDWAIRLASIED